jgi:hypothetical protein
MIGGKRPGRIKEHVAPDRLPQAAIRMEIDEMSRSLRARTHSSGNTAMVIANDMAAKLENRAWALCEGAANYLDQLPEYRTHFRFVRVMGHQSPVLTGECYRHFVGWCEQMGYVSPSGVELAARCLQIARDLWRERYGPLTPAIADRVVLAPLMPFLLCW